MRVSASTRAAPRSRVARRGSRRPRPGGHPRSGAAPRSASADSDGGALGAARAGPVGLGPEGDRQLGRFASARSSPTTAHHAPSSSIETRSSWPRSNRMSCWCDAPEAAAQSRRLSPAPTRGLPVLFASAKHVPASAPTTAICGALTSRHPPIMTIRASLPVTDWLVRLGEQRRTRARPSVGWSLWRTKQRRNANLRPIWPTPIAGWSGWRTAARDEGRAMSGPEIRIVGGTLVDGTGAPGRPGTVEVRDGRLRLTAPAGHGAGGPHDRRHRQGRGARVHRPPLPLGADDPRRAAPRAEGPPGHHDRGHRGRRQQLCAVRDPGGPRRVRPPELRARRRPATNAQDEDRLVDGRELPGPVRRDRQPQHRLPRRQLAAPDRRPSAGRTSRRRRASAPGCRRSSARRWRRAPSGCQLGPRLPAGELRHTDELAELTRRGRAGTAASTTPTSATRSATASSIRSARRSRSAGSARRRPTSPTSTTAQTFPGGPDQMLDLVDAAAQGGPRRHVRRLSRTSGRARGS